MFCSSVVSTVVGWPFASYRYELGIADDLEDVGAYVEWKPRTKSWGAGFTSTIGLEKIYFRVTGVAFEDSELDTETLSKLPRFRHLSWLELRNCSIEDDDIQFLASCQALKGLDLRDNPLLSDVGLQKIEAKKTGTAPLDGLLCLVHTERIVD